MFFTQLDTILTIERGKSLEATKNLSLAEEYLQDHFPGFPVMPGVMMLEALTQAAAWLIRYSTDFQHSVVLLKEARNVKYSGFVQPGQTLQISVEWLKASGLEVSVKATGRVGEQTTVSARLVLVQYDTGDLTSQAFPAEPDSADAESPLKSTSTSPMKNATDAYIQAEAKRLGAILRGPLSASSEASTKPS